MYVLLAFLSHVYFLASILGDLTITETFDYLNRGGVLALLILILFGGWRKWWVFGWVFRDSENRTDALQRERDDWRDLALHGTTLAEQTVNLFKRSKDE